MPDEIIGDSDDLGIGPTIQDPAQKDTPAPPPAPLLAPPQEKSQAAPPESAPDDQKTGLPEKVDWSKVNFRRGKETDVPESHREEFRHRQREWREYQAENSRREQDISRREQDLEARQHDLETRMSRLEQIEKRLSEAPPTPTNQAEAGRAARRVSDMLKDPELDEDTRSALELMQQAFEELWTERMGDRLEKIDKIVPRIEQMEVNEAQTFRTNLRSQIDEAEALYGTDINEYTVLIRRALGLSSQWKQVDEPIINPATGQPHTVTSLYELFSGITARKAATMRAEDADIRDSFKKAAAPAASRPSPPATGDISESEARAELRSAGFGRR